MQKTSNVENRISGRQRLAFFHQPFKLPSQYPTHELSDIYELSGSQDHDSREISSEPPCQTDEQKSPRSTCPLALQKDGACAEVVSDDAHLSTTSPPHAGQSSRAPSALSLPLQDIPNRTSSTGFVAKRGTQLRQSSSISECPSWKLPPPSAAGRLIPPRGRSNSPVRAALKTDPFLTNTIGRSPTKTSIRKTPPLDILDFEIIRHSRVEMSLQPLAPLFVGGGTVEGHVLLRVDRGSTRKTTLKPLSISRLSLDVVGVEEVTDGRRWIFLSLVTELFDRAHPPPAGLVTTQISALETELSWHLQPATVVIPFCVNLPLNIGPPPYAVKQNRIRYILCATAHVKTACKRSLIRQSLNIQMLTAFDPEKALCSLRTPLLASERLHFLHGSTPQVIKLTAGLHRQIWVNGGAIFVDIHVVNNSSRKIKKIEIQLEKKTLRYYHAAAETTEESAKHLRLPSRSETELVSCSFLKRSREWSGVAAHSSEVKTCDLEVPRGHVTISTGRYFEVRYFLNVIVRMPVSKSIAVQLPVTIIHINSLDIVPNSLAQVAASVQAKRSRSVPSADTARGGRFRQGQAFAAPRRQSLDRMRANLSEFDADEVATLTHELDKSPRRFARKSLPIERRRTTMFSRDPGENEPDNRTGTAGSSGQHHLHSQRTHIDRCYQCHLRDSDCLQHSPSKFSLSSLRGRRLPRLQLSTSGLGFSDSEFDIGPDSPPKKVMLSESERKLILEHRELRSGRQVLQRHLSQSPSKGGPVKSEGQRGIPGSYWGWRNVAVPPAETTATAIGHLGQKSLDTGLGSSEQARGGLTRSAGSRSSTALRILGRRSFRCRQQCRARIRARRSQRGA